MSGGFEHVAVVHDGPRDLAVRVAPALREAVATGDAVLVCLDELSWEHVARELGDVADAVTYTPASDRYARPSGAMAVLHRFVRDSVARGAGSAWSLGAIAFDGTDADERWHRYEAAVNDVFRDLPLKGICGYDSARLPSSVIDTAMRTHAFVDDVHGRRHSPDYAPTWSSDDLPAADSVLVGLGGPDLRLVIDEGLVARQAIATAYHSRLTPTQLDDAVLAASELVTNGLRHGRPPVTFESWCTPAGEVVLRVCDNGPGIADPYPELRPPAVGLGGYGLWVVGQVCDDVFVERHDGRTAITVRIARSNAPT